MSKSKEIFMNFRELDNFELIATKKSILEKSEEFTDSLLKNGEITKQEAFAKAIRNATFWSNTAEKIKENLTEKEQFYGIEITPMNGRKILQYQEDIVWQELSKDLKDREELLKLSQNQCVIDAYGNEVPKVSVKFAKDSINVKF